MEVDHYEVLGLPSGVEGAKLTEKEISKAYKVKALQLHPDKRPDDPNAQINFQKLKSSYEVLMDNKARKLFDDLLHARRERAARRSRDNSKRRHMVEDLERRERAAFATAEVAQHREEERIAQKLKEEIEKINAMMRAERGAKPSEAQGRERRDAPTAGGRVQHQEEERIAQKLKEEIAQINAMMRAERGAKPSEAQRRERRDAPSAGGRVQHREEERIAQKLKEEIEQINAMMRAERGAKPSEAQRRERRDALTAGGRIESIDKERVLKVNWEKVAGEDYSSSRLKEVFSEFGMVEDVVMKSSKTRGSALVLMATKEAVVAATRNMCGSLSNPLLVVPLKPAAGSTDFPSAHQTVESDPLNDLKGFGYNAYEKLVFEKLQKAAASQNQD